MINWRKICSAGEILYALICLAYGFFSMYSVFWSSAFFEIGWALPISYLAVIFAFVGILFWKIRHRFLLVSSAIMLFFSSVEFFRMMQLRFGADASTYEEFQPGMNGIIILLTLVLFLSLVLGRSAFFVIRDLKLVFGQSATDGVVRLNAPD